MAIDKETLITLTADIAAAHVGNNSVAVSDVGGMIGTIFAALNGLAERAEPVAEKLQGAVSIRASIKPEHIVSMIDGKPYKMLKRHLGLNGYTPESYREAFGLPRDYPMIAAAYSESRRALAHKIGLGRKPKVEEVKPVRKPRAKKARPEEAGTEG